MGEINHFVDVIEGKAENLCHAQDGSDMMKPIYESAKTRYEVLLD